jgi:ABC-type branched-subunit amino acid transport system substrate-binding protein
MSIGRKQRGRGLVAMAGLALLITACTGGGGGAATPAPATTAPSAAQTTAPAESPATGGEPVVICELAYYTGEFAPYGASLTADVVFPVKEVINSDPPLGRTWELVHEDIGTVGEAQAARTCLENHGAEILVSIAHGYRTYRDFMMDYWQENDAPLGPSVHGGAIPGNLGGKGTEPIFRAQGLDEALGTSGSLYAQSIGAMNIVIFATQVEGFQLAADAAQKAAEALGLTVMDRIDVPAEQPSYRAEAQRIADLKPDAVIVQAGSVESATLIKQAAEAGLSLNWIGETGWIQQEFIGTLGTEPIASQKGIGFAAFSPDTSTAAWEFFSTTWEDTPGYGDEFGPPTDQYHFSTYDLLIQTALAVEAAGSYAASAWAPAMFEVGDGGEKCYTYADCLELIRAGTDVDYDGITGPGLYTEGGVNAVNPSYTPFEADGSSGEPVLLDAAKSLELIDSIKTTATCDPESPPNTCEW